MPCVIVSDDDRCTNRDDVYKFSLNDISYSSADYDDLLIRLEKGAISHRARSLALLCNDNILVELATKTLEYELGLIKENCELMLKVLKTEHPEITQDIKSRIKTVRDQREIALRLLIAIQDCKGAFAQKLAFEISNMDEGETFIVPDYIERAINAIIPG